MTSIDPAGTRVDATRARTGHDAIAEARAAKAQIEFRAMLLRELLRPLTQELLPGAEGTGFGGSGLENAGLGTSGSEMYGFLLEGALAEHLAERWPLPTSDLADAATTTGSTNPLLERTGASIRISQERAPITLAAEATALPLVSGPTARVLTNGPHVRVVGTPVPPGASIVAPLRETAAASDLNELAELGSGGPTNRRGGVVERSSIAPAEEENDLSMESMIASRTESQIESPIASEISLGVGYGSSRLLELPDEQIQRAARLFDLPDSLVRAVILTESGGRADAVSPKGAIGLMQVMPGTARDMGVTNPRDPWENLYAGAKYLRHQLDRFGNLTEALAAYNAGPGAVERHGGVPPFRETREYVEKVLSRMRWLERDE